MKTKLLLVLLGYLCLYTNLSAQKNNWEPCGYTQDIRNIKAHHPQYAQAIESTFQKAKNRMLEKNMEGENPSTYRLPVVIHLVHKEDDENLPDAVAQSQIDLLNENFAHLNANTSTIRSVFQDLTADAKIEFYLATTDPNGNPTTGITHTTTSVSSFYGIEDDVKFEATGGISAWDTHRYLNIWVCNMNGTSLGEEFIGTYGRAYPPIEAAESWPPGAIPDNIDEVSGVVLNTQVLGINNPAATNLVSNGIADEGRVAIHEIGHYLGLRHTWGDPDWTQDGCFIDDGINDTPIADNHSRPTGDEIPPCTDLFAKNTCGVGETGDLPDMIENYMDYSLGVCQSMFTKEQIGLMRSMIELARPALLEEIEMDFFVENTNIFANEAIQFTPETVNVVNYLWDFGDGNTSTDPIPTHTYTSEGLYTISLTVSNEYNELTEVKTDYIQVEGSIVGLTNTDSPTPHIFPSLIQDGSLYIEYQTPITATIKIYGINGKLMLLEQANNLSHQRLEVAHLPTGIYLLTIETPQGKHQQKILKR